MSDQEESLYVYGTDLKGISIMQSVPYLSIITDGYTRF